GRRRQYAPAEIADVEVLAFERRAGFAHLRVQDHLDGIALGPHRKSHAEIANHWTDDVAGPAPIRRAVCRAPAQADAGGIDRFLSERPEPLALKRDGA